MRQNGKRTNKPHNIVLDVSHLFCFLFRLRLTKKQNKCPPQGTFPICKKTYQIIVEHTSCKITQILTKFLESCEDFILQE